ncbi:hypothetical protein GCM10027570_50740 [Streptomonospora sediminis]
MDFDLPDIDVGDAAHAGGGCADFLQTVGTRFGTTVLVWWAEMLLLAAVLGASALVTGSGYVDPGAVGTLVVAAIAAGPVVVLVPVMPLSLLGRLGGRLIGLHRVPAAILLLALLMAGGGAVYAARTTPLEGVAICLLGMLFLAPPLAVFTVQYRDPATARAADQQRRDDARLLKALAAHARRIRLGDTVLYRERGLWKWWTLAWACAYVAGIAGLWAVSTGETAAWAQVSALFLPLFAAPALAPPRRIKHSAPIRLTRDTLRVGRDRVPVAALDPASVRNAQAPHPPAGHFGAAPGPGGWGAPPGVPAELAVEPVPLGGRPPGARTPIGAVRLQIGTRHDRPLDIATRHPGGFTRALAQVAGYGSRTDSPPHFHQRGDLAGA